MGQVYQFQLPINLKSACWSITFGWTVDLRLCRLIMIYSMCQRSQDAVSTNSLSLSLSNLHTRVYISLYVCSELYSKTKPRFIAQKCVKIGAIYTDQEREWATMLLMGFISLQSLMDLVVAGFSLLIGLGIFAFTASILCTAAFLQNAKDVS